MGDDQVAFVMTCDAEDYDLIRKVIAEHADEVQASPRRQLDGASAVSWVLVAAIAVQKAPALIHAIGDFLTRNSVREIKVGKVSITNPQPEDVTRILDMLEQSKKDDE